MMYFAIYILIIVLIFLFFGLSKYFFKKFPKSKISEFLRKNIVTDEDLEELN